MANTDPLEPCTTEELARCAQCMGPHTVRGSQNRDCDAGEVDHRGWAWRRTLD
jgi:hypothetical protein